MLPLHAAVLLLELASYLENDGHWPGMQTSKTVAADLHLLVMGAHMKWAEAADTRHQLIWLSHDLAQFGLFWPMAGCTRSGTVLSFPSMASAR